MSRPRVNTEEMANTNIQLPRALLDRLDRVAEERLLGRRLLVRRAIEQLLDRLEDRAVES